MPKDYLQIKQCDISLLALLRNSITSDFVFASFYSLYTNRAGRYNSNEISISTVEVANYALNELYTALGKESYIGHEIKAGFCILNLNNLYYKNICRVFSSNITRSPFIICVSKNDGVPRYRLFFSNNEMENYFHNKLTYALTAKKNILNALLLNKEMHHARLSSPPSIPFHTPKKHKETVRLNKPLPPILPNSSSSPSFRYNILFFNYIKERKTIYPIESKSVPTCSAKRKHAIEFESSTKKLAKRGEAQDSYFPVNPMSFKCILN